MNRELSADEVKALYPNACECIFPGADVVDGQILVTDDEDEDWSSLDESVPKKRIDVVEWLAKIGKFAVQESGEDIETKVALFRGDVGEDFAGVVILGPTRLSWTESSRSNMGDYYYFPEHRLWCVYGLDGTTVDELEDPPEGVPGDTSAWCTVA